MSHSITEARLLALLARSGVRGLFGYYPSDPQVKACVDDLAWALSEHDLDRN